MHDPGARFLQPFFRFIVAKRWWIIAVYALLAGPGIYYALQVGQDNSLDRLIVKSDPDYITSQEFGKVFSAGEFALVLFEADDPFTPERIRRFDEIERKLAKLPRTTTNSIVSVFRRAKAGFEPTADQVEALRRFATGTDAFRKQGLVGDHHLSIPTLIN